MARKSKDTIIGMMATGFSKTTADVLIDWCKGTKGAGNPWFEFIDPDRFSDKTYKEWTSLDADTYLNERWAKATSRKVPPPWDGSDPLGFRDAAIEMMSQHFICTNEAGFSLYQIVDTVNRVVEPLVPESLTVQVGYALRDALEQVANRPSEPGLISTMLGFYKCNASRVDKPVLLGQKGGEEYCLHRATIEADPLMPIPYFRMFLDRLNDPEAVGAYIAACYYGLYVGRQTLWISDQHGLSGKSSVWRVLAHLFGERIVTALNAKLLENVHISSHFVGKKLVIAGDNNNPRLLLTGAFKEISGNDKVLVNPKYLTPHSTYLGCRIVVLSNPEPHIIGATHSQSRILWIKLDEMPREQLDPQWEAKAEQELPGLLAWALECYKARCPDNFEIAVNDAVKDAVHLKVRESEEEYAIPFHHAFVYTGDPKDRVSGEEFYKVMSDAKLSRYDIKNLKEWMDVTYDVSRHPTKHGYIYRCIRLKTAYDRRTANNWQMDGEDISDGNKAQANQDRQHDYQHEDWQHYDA